MTRLTERERLSALIVDLATYRDRLQTIELFAEELGGRPPPRRGARRGYELAALRRAVDELDQDSATLRAIAREHSQAVRMLAPILRGVLEELCVQRLELDALRGVPPSKSRSELWAKIARRLAEERDKR